MPSPGFSVPARFATISRRSTILLSAAAAVFFTTTAAATTSTRGFSGIWGASPVDMENGPSAANDNVRPPLPFDSLLVCSRPPCPRCTRTHRSSRVQTKISTLPWSSGRRRSQWRRSAVTIEDDLRYGPAGAPLWELRHPSSSSEVLAKLSRHNGGNAK